ncbi:hypothetical protein U8607_07830 [Methylobacterium durans]|uniref:hypothetical protein n=1 Tax=Methylobacterium durans TaxID=2202825 RepID=UPI002AFF7F20|nr:hypothetical protein [Methylobacterium durans]MEA1831992.1 hypothetical protein [Methylobacterium durans]
MFVVVVVVVVHNRVIVMVLMDDSAVRMLDIAMMMVAMDRDPTGRDVDVLRESAHGGER